MEDALIERGALHWLHADAPDGSVQAYAHPYLVVQEDVFNRSRISTVIVCALTTNLQRINEPGNLLLEPGEGGLSKQSVVVVSQIISVEKIRLGPRIGMLAPERVDRVLEGLRFQQRSYSR